MSTFTGNKEKLKTLSVKTEDYSNINVTDATSATTNSDLSNKQNAPILQTASSNQSTLVEGGANSSAVTSTQQQQPSFSVAF